MSAGRAAAVWFGVAVALLAALAPAPAARAAFEVRDASPAALGAASLDIAAPPLFEPARTGLAASVTHASLYQAEGLTNERASLAVALGGLRASASWNQLGFPGAREHTVRLALEEAGAGPVTVSLVAERLALAIEGEPSRGGIALGAAMAARVPLPRATLECSVAGDRVWRSDGLQSLGAGPSLPFLLRVRSGAIAVGWMDRWEASGAGSPRLVLDFALGRSACVRLARGTNPARAGAALALRRGRIELSVARLDRSEGGSVGSVALGLAGSGAEGHGPVEGRNPQPSEAPR